LDTAQVLAEYILKNGKKWTVNDIFKYNEEGKQAFLRSNKSFLPIFSHYLQRVHLFQHFRLYRIEPNEAKSPIKNYDDSELSHNARNLAAV
jgi:hypothetical protein